MASVDIKYGHSACRTWNFHHAPPFPFENGIGDRMLQMLHREGASPDGVRVDMHSITEQPDSRKQPNPQHAHHKRSADEMAASDGDAYGALQPEFPEGMPASQWQEWQLENSGSSVRSSVRMRVNTTALSAEYDAEDVSSPVHLDLRETGQIVSPDSAGGGSTPDTESEKLPTSVTASQSENKYSTSTVQYLYSAVLPSDQLRIFADDFKQGIDIGIQMVMSSIVAAVEDGLVQTPPQAILPTSSLSELEKSALMRRCFRLMRPSVMAIRPWGFSNKDAATIRDHCENARQNRIEFIGIRKPKTGFRTNQLKLKNISSPSQYQRVISERRMQMATAIKEKSLAVRVSVIRCYIQFCVECEHCSPWELDDALMERFLIIMSLRYTDWRAVSAVKGHVLEFFRAFLGIFYEKKMVRSEWVIDKSRRLLANESPLGRTLRPGLTREAIIAMCEHIYNKLSSSSNRAEQKYLVNLGLVIGATYEKAMRLGEFCVGDEFDSRVCWTREVINLIAERSTNWHQGLPEVALIKPPPRKMPSVNPVIRQASQQPLVVDLLSKEKFSLAVWAPRAVKYDPLDDREDADLVPAFRAGGYKSSALKQRSTAATMKDIALIVVPDAEKYDYGGHSARIGRFAAYKHTVTGRQNPHLIDRGMNHNSKNSNVPYAVHGTTSEDMLALDRETVNTVVRPVETVVRFDTGTSPVIYLVRDAQGHLKRLDDVPLELGLVDSDMAEDTAEFPKQSAAAAAADAKTFDETLQCDATVEELSSTLDDEYGCPMGPADNEEDQLSSSLNEEELSRDLDEMVKPVVSTVASANSSSAKTGPFGQPAGRPRKGHTWNTDVGIWVSDNGALMTQFFSRIDPKTSK